VNLTCGRVIDCGEMAKIHFFCCQIF